MNNLSNTLQPSTLPTPQFIESLSFKSMSFSYDEGPQVIRDLTFDIPVGKTVLVTGPAGNGQSTFLKLLAVLVQPQSGQYLINGLDTTQMSFEEFLPLRKRIAYTFDYGGLFANRTLRDNLTLPLLYHKICSPDEANDIAQSFAKEFRFEGRLAQRPAAVSGGLRKLICVIRAFILQPEMIVMDDPFTGVDPESAKRLIRLIHERQETGSLKHVYFTSRDEVWPARLGYEPLFVDQSGFSFGSGEGKVA